jgi:4'-phosphopantetheinyl transferase EntD
MQRTDFPLLAPLLPPDVVAVIGEPRHRRMPLLEAESEYLSSRSMQPQRKREFRVGRACAREALSRFGWAGWPLLPDASRAPVWPDGMVGSITHSMDYCAVAVGRRRAWAGIGIDAEAIGRVQETIAPLVCMKDELFALDKCSADRRHALLALLFSAKESVFKAVFPRTSVVFDFTNIGINIEPDTRTFSAYAPSHRLNRILGCLEGRFFATRAHLVTTALLRERRMTQCEF